MNPPFFPRTCFVIAAFLFATCALKAAENSAIKPGETLEMRVAEDSSLDGNYLVRRGGYIIVKNLGRVLVAGKNLKEAQQSLQQTLETSELAKLKKATIHLENSGKIERQDIQNLIREKSHKPLELLPVLNPIA